MTARPHGPRNGHDHGGGANTHIPPVVFVPRSVGGGEETTIVRALTPNL